MSIDTSGLPFSKGETRKKVKARRKRKERIVIADVRSEVKDRDNYCRLYWFHMETRKELIALFGPCSGRSELAHYNKTHRRSKTRNLPAEQRHDRKHAMMLCAFHSREYDQNRMRIEELTPLGCDGPVRFTRDGKSWEEQK